ncbi:flavo protein [Terfezia boudieri ATCC MYA-4762]|uniref:Flavo protein n=1 Tax=Terfezia boudieri ATCC MYA-4762 TaxID=1051890 RepID=A0A3N4L7N1_9PEZI|nr:flavo protein [Terfezia boudieri ATCC MYA-4762]
MDHGDNNTQFVAPGPSTPFSKKHLLLACTGSTAAVMLPEMLSALTPYSAQLEINIILTPSCLHFLPDSLTRPSPGVVIPRQYPIVSNAWTNNDEWVKWAEIGDPVLHIELRKWADMLAIAPLTADFLAMMVNGFANGLLGGVVRAWDVEKRIVVAPAMNTFMWQHPMTEDHMNELRNRFRWVHVLEPAEERLACGGAGTGAQTQWWEVVRYLVQELGLKGQASEGLMDLTRSRGEGSGT